MASPMRSLMASASSYSLATRQRLTGRPIRRSVQSFLSFLRTFLLTTSWEASRMLFVER